MHRLQFWEHIRRCFWDWCDVSLVRANLAAAGAPAEVVSGRAFNVAGGHSYSLLDLLEVLGRIIGQTPEPLFVDPRPGDVRHSSASIEAARSALGWTPEVSFVDGLERTVAWFSGAV